MIGLAGQINDTGRQKTFSDKLREEMQFHVRRVEQLEKALGIIEDNPQFEELVQLLEAR